MPSIGSVTAHSLDYCVVHLCQNFRNKRGGRVTAKESQIPILFFNNEISRTAMYVSFIEVN